MVTKGYQKGVYERVTKGIMGRNRWREQRLEARPAMRMLWYGGGHTLIRTFDFRRLRRLKAANRGFQ